jgi:threonine dehydratase
MPRDASPQKVAAARSYGAAIDQDSSSGSEAIERAAWLASETGRTLVQAYDDHRIIAGQGTLGLELLEQVPDLDLVVVPVSGGGLVAGVAVAIKSVRPSARIVAVEPELAPTLAHALRAGRPISVESRSLADGLGAPAIGAACFPLCARYVDEVVHVSDLEIVQAMRWIYESAKLACEPAGAAALAALLTHRIPLQAGNRVAAIVSGGNIQLSTTVRLLAASRALPDAARPDDAP